MGPFILPQIRLPRQHSSKGGNSCETIHFVCSIISSARRQRNCYKIVDGEKVTKLSESSTLGTISSGLALFSQIETKTFTIGVLVFPSSLSPRIVSNRTKEECRPFSANTWLKKKVKLRKQSGSQNASGGRRIQFGEFLFSLSILAFYFAR